MPVSSDRVKKFSAIFLIVVIFSLAVIILWPIAMSIVIGLLLAYVCDPLYKRLLKVVKERNSAALLVGLVLALIIFIPIWFLTPIVIQQLFDMFTFLQTLDVGSFVQQVMPGASTQVQIDTTNLIITIISKTTAGVIGTAGGVLLDIPTVLLHCAVVLFVFYFALRDSDYLKKYVSDLSPLRKDKERLLKDQFKEITNSILYGQVIIGILQGVATGIGLLVFGVPKALLLTFFAIIASIIPIVGPWLVWMPAAVYLFSTGNTAMAVGFTIYCILFVSTIDNIVRPYLVSRKTKSSSGVVLIGMIGGLIVFGPLGLIIGPLVLEYVILFLDAYKNNALADMFRV